MDPPPAAAAGGSHHPAPPPKIVGGPPQPRRNPGSPGTDGSPGKKRPEGLVVAKHDEQQTGALFSPTHFAHDLFAPHTTTADVKMKELQLHRKSRPSMPSALNGAQPEYSPATANIPPPDAPLSPTTMNRSFLPMVEAMARFNTPGGEQVSEAEWDAMEITWCVPDLQGIIIDLVQGGREIPVRFAERDRYVMMAREKLQAQFPQSQKAAVPAGEKKKRKSLTVQAKGQDEEKEHVLFSPTHFAHDLFAPHTTTAQVDKNVQQNVRAGKGHRPSLPQAIGGDKPAEYTPQTSHGDPANPDAPAPLSPRTLNKDFGTMVDELAAMNRPGGEQVTPEEWNDFDVTWCVPMDGVLHDLIPDGKGTRVRFEDKDRFCQLAREKLREHGAAADKKAAKKKRLSLAPVTAPAQDEEKEAKLFSPTHFAHDLFAPHQTTQQVEANIQKEGGRRVSVPDAMAHGKRGVQYEPSEQRPPDPGAPLSPGTVRRDFIPMVDLLQKFNTKGGEQLTEAEWDDMEITWCVPFDGELFELVPNGVKTKVLMAEKDRYCSMARVRLEELAREPPPKKKKPKRLSLAPVTAPAQDEEKEHKMFSPTHFAHDLFAPHQTTQQIEKKIEASGGARTSLPNALAHGEGQGVVYQPTVAAPPDPNAVSPLSPRTMARDFMPMINELEKLGKDKQDGFTEADWDEIEVTWCVPIDGTLHDLLPGGKDMKVQYNEKDRYCMLARAKCEQMAGGGGPGAGIQKKKQKKRPSLKIQEEEEKREQKEHAMFSPTHFAHDLFAPHQTTKDVAKNASEDLKHGGVKRPSLPQAMGAGGAEYEPEQRPVVDDPAHGDFAPILDELSRMNTPGSETQLTEAEWNDLDVTWCVPDRNGVLHDLVTNGRTLQVKLAEKDKYCAMARAKLEEIQPAGAGGAKGKKGRPGLSVAVAAPKAKDEEKDAKLFSPTHFAQDLFAPHVTTKQVEEEGARRAQRGKGHRPSLPAAVAGGKSVEYEPVVAEDSATTAKRFWPMIDAIAQFNTPEGETVGPEEFAEMDIFFCVPNPLNYTEILDLVANGRNVQVTLKRKDEFVGLARTMYHKKMAEDESSRAPPAPLSPRSLHAQFAPMIDEIARMNEAGGDQYTEEEFAELDITWCIPCGGEIIDIKPNGRNIKVTLKKKDEYVRMARMRLDFEMQRQKRAPPAAAAAAPAASPPRAVSVAAPPRAAPTTQGARPRQKACSLDLQQVAKKDEEQDAKLFSPTHFAHDLFAPHTTTKEVKAAAAAPQRAGGEGNGPDARRPTLPSAFGPHAAKQQYTPQYSPQKECEAGRLTPRSLADEFYPMVEDLASANRPGGIRYTEADWDELGITFCIPLAGRAYDLIPGGRDIPVRLGDRDRFVSLVREYRQRATPQAYGAAAHPAPPPHQLPPSALGAQNSAHDALMQILAMPQPRFDELKVTWTLPQVGSVVELIVGGRTSIVAYEDRFRYADLVTQARRAVDAGRAWAPVPPPARSGPAPPARFAPAPPGTASPPKLHHGAARGWASPSASDAATSVSSLPPVRGLPLAAGEEPTLEAFLAHCRLPHLLDQIRAEGVTTMDDLCELLDEDLQFITKVLHRRRLINALQPLRIRYRSKQQQQQQH